MQKETTQKRPTALSMRKSVHINFEFQPRVEHKCSGFKEANILHKAIFVKHGQLPQLGDFIACDCVDFFRFVGAQWHSPEKVTLWVDDQIR